MLTRRRYAIPREGSRPRDPRFAEPASYCNCWRKYTPRPKHIFSAREDARPPLIMIAGR